MICHVCKNRGHWKGECPISRAGLKSADPSVYVKPAGLESRGLNMSQSHVVPLKTANAKGVDEMYAPFVSDGFVSLDGEDKMPVKILRDIGATESLIF